VTVHGTVRFWLYEEGWGVIDSARTPGGCWAHFSAVEVSGFRTLQAGQSVEVDWEPADQDGYAWRALSVRPAPDG
jgi:cold shock protein